ncbi:transposon Tf2-9 polyprotein [Trichonephila clavipes]|uniref:Transposon Tf2-9 polyprotein n=1 Tax=Trichonephila clavipes TaxID=2585209 RepID=A0A8X6RM75_TRICX|nr:transposon Tf2-9 polyprotein [Trichonephila clavipes]
MVSEATWYKNVSLNENNKCFDINFKLDTGAEPKGSLIINCSTDKLKNVPLPFYVVNVKSKPVLGLRGCKELKLIERIDACSVSSLHQEAHCAPLRIILVMFRGARKEELILVADELDEEITPEMRVIDLKNLILDSGKYKNNKEFIDDYLDSIISDRKSKEEQARVTAESQLEF